MLQTDLGTRALAGTKDHLCSHILYSSFNGKIPCDLGMQRSDPCCLGPGRALNPPAITIPHKLCAAFIICTCSIRICNICKRAFLFHIPVKNGCIPTVAIYVAWCNVSCKLLWHFSDCSLCSTQAHKKGDNNDYRHNSTANNDDLTAVHSALQDLARGRQPGNSLLLEGSKRCRSHNEIGRVGTQHCPRPSC